MKNPGDSQYLVKVHTPQPTHTYRAPRTAHRALRRSPVHVPSTGRLTLRGTLCAPTLCAYLVCILPRVYTTSCIPRAGGGRIVHGDGVRPGQGQGDAHPATHGGLHLRRCTLQVRIHAGARVHVHMHASAAPQPCA